MTLNTSSVTFDTSGQLTSPGTIGVSGYTPPGSDPLWFNLVLDAGSALVQFGGSTTAQATDQEVTQSDS